MYTVEIYVGSSDDGYWMIALEDSSERKASAYMRDCIAEGRPVRLTYEP